MRSSCSLLRFERRSLSLARTIRWCSAPRLWAEDSFRALNGVLRLLLPIASTLSSVVWIIYTQLSVWKSTTSSCDRLYRCSHRGCHPDCIWIVSCSTFDAITRRKEGVEALNEIWVTSKKFGNTIYDARSVNSSSA